MNDRLVDATAYVTLEATRYRYGMVSAETGLKPVTGLKAVRVTQGRPSSLAPDQIAVKVKLRLPAAIFDPITPSAVITIPEDRVLRGEVEVEVEEPGDGGIA